MATQTNNLLLVEAGVTRTLDATNDDLQIGAATTFTKVLTTSGGLTVTGNAAVSGNLEVAGDIVSRGTSNLLIQDAILDLATNNSATAATPGGFTVQMNRNSGFTASTVTVFVAGVPATSAPTFTNTDAGSSTLLVAGDIVVIYGSKIASNDGLYVVQSVSGAAFPQTVTIKGVGGTAVGGYTPFAQNQFTASTGNTAQAYKIDLAVGIFADGSANFKDSGASNYAKGTFITAYKANASDSDFSGNGAYSVPSSSLQGAYTSGATITTASSTDIAFTLTSGGFTVNGGGAVDLGFTGTDVTTFKVGAGAVDIATTGNIDIATTASARTVQIATGAAAQAVTLGSTNSTSALTLQAGTGALTHTAGGAYDVNAAGAVTIDSSGSTIGIGTDNVTGAVSVGTQGARNIAIGSASATSATVDAVVVSLDATDNSNFTVTGSAKSLTLDVAGGGAQRLNLGSAGTGTNAIRMNATAGGIDIDASSGGITVDTTGTLSIDSVDTTNLTMTANAAGAKTLTVEAANGGAGTATLALKAKTTIQIGDTAGSSLAEVQSFLYFTQVSAGLRVTAGETIAVGQAIVGEWDAGSSTTRFFKAANNAATDAERNVYGVAQSAAAAAGDVFSLATLSGVQFLTALTGLASTDVGKTLYLGTAGALTTTAPTASNTTVFKVGYIVDYNGGPGGVAIGLFQPQFIAKNP